MTTETAENTTQDTVSVDVNALKKAVSAAKTAHTKAERAATEARASDDVDFDALMALMDAVKSSQRTLAKAESAVTKAEFEAGAEERDKIVELIRNELDGVIQPLIQDVIRTKIRGFSIRITDEGGIEIDATVPNMPKRAGGSGGRGRTVWMYEGTQFTSRELLEQIGRKTDGFDIDEIFEKASRGIGAGFDVHVKRLAKLIGAVGTKTDGSSIDLG